MGRRGLGPRWPKSPVKIDTVLRSDLDTVGDHARELHAMGFDGVYTQEANSDVTFPLLLAAQAAPIDIYTNVAIAFPRSPMHLAYAAFDLQRVANGRFALVSQSDLAHIRALSAPSANRRTIAELLQDLHRYSLFHDGERSTSLADYTHVDDADVHPPRLPTIRRP